MLLAAGLMFVLGTMDLAFGLRHNLDAFVYFKGSASVEFSDTRYWVNVMKMGTYVSQTFVGDTILVCPFTSISVAYSDPLYRFIVAGSSTRKIGLLLWFLWSC